MESLLRAPRFFFLKTCMEKAAFSQVEAYIYCLFQVLKVLPASFSLCLVVNPTPISRERFSEACEMVLQKRTRSSLWLESGRGCCCCCCCGYVFLKKSFLPLILLIRVRPGLLFMHRIFWHLGTLKRNSVASCLTTTAVLACKNISCFWVSFGYLVAEGEVLQADFLAWIFSRGDSLLGGYSIV